MDFIKKYKTEIILFIIALLAHLFFFSLLLFKYGPNSFYQTSIDACEFFQLGKNLFENHVFSSQILPPFYLNSFRTIGYPLYLAFFRFFTVGAYLPILFQNIIGALSVVVVYQLCLLVVKNQKISFLTAMLFALNPLSNYWANIIEPDTILVFLSLLGIFYFIKFYKNNTENKYLFLSALFLGLGSLFKPVVNYYPIILVIFLLATQWKHRRKLMKPVLIFLAIFFIIMSFWNIRNYYHFKVFDSISMPGVNFYYFSNSIDRDMKELDDYVVEIEKIYPTGHRDIRAEKELTRLSLKKIFNNFDIYLPNHLIGAIQFFLNDGHKEAYYLKHYKAMLWFDLAGAENKSEFGIAKELRQGNWFFIVDLIKRGDLYTTLYLLFRALYLIGYCIVIYGLITAYKKNKELFLYFLLFTILFLYIAMAAGPWGSTVRYRLPVLPGILLIFTYSLFELFGK